jgi:hypothetical protein
MLLKVPTLGFCFEDFKCSGHGDNECIDKQFQCDEHNNCPHSQDQSDCISPTITSTTTNITPTSDPYTYQECKSTALLKLRSFQLRFLF